MDRETYPISVGKYNFDVKSYATAREANAIQQAYFIGTKLEIAGDTPKISEFNPGVRFEVEQEMIKQLVVSMDENADGIVDRCLDLPSSQYQELISKLDEIVSKKN